jgi:hypothetical protein
VDVIATEVAVVEGAGVVVAPQPANEVLELRGDLRGIRRVQLFDAVGKVALDRSLPVDGSRAEIPVAGLQAGTYVLNLLDGDGVQVLRRQVSVVH